MIILYDCCRTVDPNGNMHSLILRPAVHSEQNVGGTKVRAKKGRPPHEACRRLPLPPSTPSAAALDQPPPPPTTSPRPAPPCPAPVRACDHSLFECAFLCDDECRGVLSRRYLSLAAAATTYSLLSSRSLYVTRSERRVSGRTSSTRAPAFR